MTSIVAVCPAASMVAANAALEALGFGPRNFSVPAYSTRATPTHGALHCWGTFMQAALEAVPQVVIDVGEGDPADRTRALITAHGATWGVDAPEFPDGPVVAGALHRYREDETLWIVIQSFDRSVFNAPPATYPALLRRARQPGAVEPWKQPESTEPYNTINPFTGRGDVVTDEGKTWLCVDGSAGEGDNRLNIWKPGVFGWQDLGIPVDMPPPEPEPEPANIWAPGIAVTVGQEYYYPDANGTLYRVLQSHTTQAGWTPPAVPALWAVV